MNNTSRRPHRVPRLARLLLLAVTPARFREQIDGDLRETYLVKRDVGSHLSADLWYWRQLFSLNIIRLLFSGRGSVSFAQKRTLTPFFAIVSDARFGVRTFGKQPLFTAAVVFTLALGIGATTSIFTVVNAVLLRPLPYENPEDIVMVFRTVPRFGFTRSTASFPDFDDWRKQSTSTSDMAAYGYTTVTFIDPSAVSRWQGYRVTANLFPLLGASPLLGRLITPADDVPTAESVILLSHAVWRGNFGADSTIVGRTVLLDDDAATVVGVMPAEFDFPTRNTQFWIPLRGDAETMERDTNFLTVIARLGNTSSVEAAQSELSAIASQIDEELADGNRGYGIFVEQRHTFVVRNARTALIVFMGAVAMVLLVALTNVANLMLAKGTTRAREIAVRTALGAGRGRIIQQLMTESTLLAALGGLLGLATAAGLTRLIVLFGAQQLPRVNEIHMDIRVLLFTTATSIASGIAFGTIPALISSRTNPQRSLKGTMAAVGIGPSGRQLQQILVVGEIAIAMTLTIGAGLLLNSFAKLTAVDPGFRPDNIVAGRVAAPRPQIDIAMREDTAARSAAMATQRVFYEAVLEHAASQPGAVAVGLSYGMPLGGYTFSRVVQPEGLTYEEGGEPVISGNIVGADYFQVMGIPVIRGRVFDASDRSDSPSVIVINEAMARAFWPDENALGKRIKIGNGDRPWSTIVGLVANTVARSLADDPLPTYFRPYAQAQWPDGMFVVMRTTAPAAQVVQRLRDDIHSINASVPLTDVTTASQLIAESLAEPRFRTFLLGVFGGVAAVLALVGIYGVISFTVENRTRDIGIRLALGANRGNVMRMVFARGMGLVSIGVALGVFAAIAMTRFLRGMLYNVAPIDPLTYIVCTVGLAILAAVACYGPARKAANRDPLGSLRME